MISFTWALWNSGELGATCCSGMNRSRWYLVSTWNRSCEPCISREDNLSIYIYIIITYIYIYYLLVAILTFGWTMLRPDFARRRVGIMFFCRNHPQMVVSGWWVISLSKSVIVHQPEIEYYDTDIDINIYQHISHQWYIWVLSDNICCWLLSWSLTYYPDISEKSSPPQHRCF